jgi:hypothetical protein
MSSDILKFCCVSSASMRVTVKANGGSEAVMLYIDDGISARNTSISRTPRNNRGRSNR